MFKDSLCPPSLRERVSPKSLIGLGVQESLMEVGVGLAGVAEFLVWLSLANANLAHELNGKKIN